MVEVLNKCSEPSPERISLSQPLGLLLKYLSHTKKTSLCSSFSSSQYITVLVISDSYPSFGHCRWYRRAEKSTIMVSGRPIKRLDTSTFKIRFN